MLSVQFFGQFFSQFFGQFFSQFFSQFNPFNKCLILFHACPLASLPTLLPTLLLWLVALTSMSGSFPQIPFSVMAASNMPP